jgi:hypothetical protein
MNMKVGNCQGGNERMKHLTVLFCTNADGSDKLKPLVIGKFAKLRCFKNITHLTMQICTQQECTDDNQKLYGFCLPVS